METSQSQAENIPTMGNSLQQGQVETANLTLPKWSWRGDNNNNKKQPIKQQVISGLQITTHLLQCSPALPKAPQVPPSTAKSPSVSQYCLELHMYRFSKEVMQAFNSRHQGLCSMPTSAVWSLLAYSRSLSINFLGSPESPSTLQMCPSTL